MDFRKAIVDELKRQGRTRYWLAKQSDLAIGTVYDYIAGRTSSSGETLERIFDSLGLKVVSTKPAGKPRKRR